MSATPPERDLGTSSPDESSHDEPHTEGTRTDDRAASERSVDDLTTEDLAEDDIALTEDDATRGPFRPTTPLAGEETNFAEGPDGESIDPVYREATPEIDVYEDLPSRRARAEPDAATDDAASPEDGESSP